MSADRQVGEQERDSFELPLFPLRSVLFPGGLLGLKVFEVRYLDLIGACLRSATGFGVVALRQGSEVRVGEEPVDLETIGVAAEILDVDSPQSGILNVRCRGSRRFATSAVRQQDDGLWIAQAQWLPDDEPAAVDDKLQASAKALVSAVDALHAQGARPFLEPLQFDDAGWVANRWCELLPIPLAAKQKLMALDDPLIRLGLVDEFLRKKGVVS
ncbi:LON peptidase substrate-binding domain-containing protein [Piscinibacter sakaiensis]|uniref:LON peptidase substrate-binding domain-containing protein n=1 Tax=Piscinibacter sakaiensis TaxID=1547922 RepID=UPI003AAE985D